MSDEHPLKLVTKLFKRQVAADRLTMANNQMKNPSLCENHFRSFSGLYFPAFGMNRGKHVPEKLPIRTIFTQYVYFVIPYRAMLHSYRNQLIDLYYKSIDWCGLYICVPLA